MPSSFEEFIREFEERNEGRLGENYRPSSPFLNMLNSMGEAERQRVRSRIPPVSPPTNEADALERMTRQASEWERAAQQVEETQQQRARMLEQEQDRQRREQMSQRNRAEQSRIIDASDFGSLFGHRMDMPENHAIWGNNSESRETPESRTTRSAFDIPTPVKKFTTLGARWDNFRESIWLFMKNMKYLRLIKIHRVRPEDIVK